MVSVKALHVAFSAEVCRGLPLAGDEAAVCLCDSGHSLFSSRRNGDYCSGIDSQVLRSRYTTTFKLEKSRTYL